MRLSVAVFLACIFMIRIISGKEFAYGDIAEWVGGSVNTDPGEIGVIRMNK